MQFIPLSARLKQACALKIAAEGRNYSVPLAAVAQRDVGNIVIPPRGHVYWIVTFFAAEATPLATTTSVLAPVSAPAGTVSVVDTTLGLATAMEL